jgi:hypothetical protein
LPTLTIPTRKTAMRNQNTDELIGFAEALRVRFSSRGSVLLDTQCSFYMASVSGE